jgi:hypothetical protein
MTLSKPQDNRAPCEPGSPGLRLHAVRTGARVARSEARTNTCLPSSGRKQTFSGGG